MDSKNDESNIARISVTAGEPRSGLDSTIVTIGMSPAAMKNFGEELIRIADQSAGGYICELSPSKPDQIVEKLGILLHPESTRLNIIREDFGQIDSCFEQDTPKPPAEQGVDRKPDHAPS